MQRTAQRVVIGLIFATALIRAWLIIGEWGFQDVDAYWQAAMRLREGGALFPVGVDPDGYAVFRYAPWFAWLWVPLTYAPRVLVEIVWGCLLGCAALAVFAALARLRRPAAWALLFLIFPWMLSLVQVGNIQPLLVAMLAFGVSRPSGPIWIAISASLKAFPLAWVLVYAARRQWSQVAWTVAIALALTLPFLFYDLTGYVTDPGASGLSLYYYFSPTVWLMAALVSALIAIGLAWKQSPWLWPAIAVAVMLAAPRSHVTAATYLVVGLLAGERDHIDSRSPASG